MTRVSSSSPSLLSSSCFLKPGFQIVVPVPRIVSVASNFWKQQGRSYGNALAITQDDPCDRSDQSSEIDSSSILATGTPWKDSQAISYFSWKPGSNDKSDRSVGTWSTWLFTSRPYTRFKMAASDSNNTSTFIEEIQQYESLWQIFKGLRAEEPEITSGKRLARNSVLLQRPYPKPMLSSMFSLLLLRKISQRSK